MSESGRLMASLPTQSPWRLQAENVILTWTEIKKKKKTYLDLTEIRTQAARMRGQRPTNTVTLPSMGDLWGVIYDKELWTRLVSCGWCTSFLHLKDDVLFIYCLLSAGFQCDSKICCVLTRNWLVKIVPMHEIPIFGSAPLNKNRYWKVSDNTRGGFPRSPTLLRQRKSRDVLIDLWGHRRGRT